MNARPNRARALRLVIAATLCLAALSAMNGCEMFSWVSQTFDTTTKALYEIEDRETVVLVDDPNNYLGDRNLKGVIASNIAFQLIESDTIGKKRVVPLEAVAALEKRLGKEYNTKAIDEVGRELNAKQVIHVSVEMASLNLEGGVMKPSMYLRVRLVDVPSGRRLFPKPEDAAMQDTATVERGFGLAVSMPIRVSPDNAPADAAKAMEVLAIRTGRRVAWMFYDHSERQPGEGFSDKI